MFACRLSVTLLGPGMAHDYLIPISGLQKTRPVIFYDQLGINRSTHLLDKPKSFWNTDLLIHRRAISLVASASVRDAACLVTHGAACWRLSS